MCAKVQQRTKMDDFLEKMKMELNAEQYEAVVYTDGPSLVVAGAGSGKTRVLTYKIAYLLHQGLSPHTIMALTFTNKAAREMKERIASVTDAGSARSLWAGTFHSIFARILRLEAPVLSLPSRFTIYDQGDMISMIKAVTKELGLNDNVYKPAMTASRITAAKNRIILPQQYLNDPEIQKRDEAQGVPMTGIIYANYMTRCRQAAALDFDDLLVYTYLLFERHPDVRTRYAMRFNYILVDEYQDTNYVQACIVRQLTQESGKVCVVGDDAQSVYGFRGAEISNMLRFASQYPGTRTFKLQRNYRSTQSITNAANSIILHNKNQIRKEIYSLREEGEKVCIRAAQDDTEEAEIVVRAIEAFRRVDGCGLDAFAVLYRTNAQSRPLEEALRKHRLSYRVYGGMTFYQRQEVKDVLAYCRLAVNPADEEAFKRALNRPARGIGSTTLSKIAALAKERGMSLWDTARQAKALGLHVNGAILGKLMSFSNLVASLIEKAARLPAGEMLIHILNETGLLQAMRRDTSSEGLNRLRNVEELGNAARDFVVRRSKEQDGGALTLYDFLQEIALLTNTDVSDDAPAVGLMTIHAAKGLEFPTVFVVGMEDNIIPGGHSGSMELEEERRLLYVAVTRAEKRCILTYARSRRRYGITEYGEPSCFLHDIDPRYVEHGTTNIHRMSGPAILKLRTLPPQQPIPSLSRPASPTRPYKSIAFNVGDKVEHARFGVGRILSLSDVGANLKATVDFINSGTKVLLLRYARLRKLD